MNSKTKTNNMNTLSNTKSVHTSQSRTTSKTLVKIGTQVYGHIDGNTLQVTTKVTERSLVALYAFAEKNNLSVTL